jgi:GTP pyrophosphokinase
MMNEISNVISGDLKVNMTSVNIDSRDGIFYGSFRLVVRNTKHLNELLHKLAKIPGVTKAVRIA